VHRKVSGATKTEAKDKLAQLLEEKRKAGTVGRRDITVRGVVDDFLAHPPQEWKSGNTLEVYTDAGTRICDGAGGVQGIGGISLARLTVGDVDRLLYGWPVLGTRRRRPDRRCRSCAGHCDVRSAAA
jgi:hypothetical protein